MKNVIKRKIQSKAVLFVLPTYPGVPQAVDMMPLSTILERPKSLIMILEFSSWL